MIAGRTRFQGARHILRFNWQWYALALAVAVVLPPIVVAPAILWSVLSLAVSHYVYDRSPLYRFTWLSLPVPPRSCVHLHAGFDETSALLGQVFPEATHRVFDLYDPAEMTEPSIARARNTTAPHADWRALPLPTAGADAVFLLFAAHELRRAPARVALFREAARVLRTGGRIVVAEHLRDWANFFAFGPGFFHFLPERAWREAARDAGLRVRRRFRVTPFVAVFELEHAA
jgi:SAM-dependent methyltransferase